METPPAPHGPDPSPNTSRPWWAFWWFFVPLVVVLAMIGAFVLLLVSR